MMTINLMQISPDVQAWLNDPQEEGYKEDVLKEMAENASYKVEILNLEEYNLTSLPPNIKEVNWITRISLGSNPFRSFPSEILSLTNLTILEINNTKLRNIPDEISKLQALTEIYFSYNALSSLPEGFFKLSELRWLDFSHNAFCSIPEGLFKLSKLRWLDFYDNKLEYISPEIGELKNLEELIIQDNKELKNLPRSLMQIRNIKRCSIKGTSISPDEENALWEEEMPVRLSEKLKLWSNCGLEGAEKFSKEEKIVLYKWIYSLDHLLHPFNFNKSTAKIVFEMLVAAGKNEEFKEHFFSIISEDCDLRGFNYFSSIGKLNEVYMIWMLLYESKNLSLCKQLQLFERAAKTIVFRIVFFKSTHSFLTEPEIQKAVVFYEVLLRDKLNLLLAIENCRYFECWKKSHDPHFTNALTIMVEKFYMDFLITMEPFDSILSGHPEYVWQKLELEKKEEDCEAAIHSLKKEWYANLSKAANDSQSM